MVGKYLTPEGWVDSKLNVDGGIGILRLDKETGIPEFKPYTIQEAEKAFRKFKHLLDYWWECKK
jgi:hypothetical protein